MQNLPSTYAVRHNACWLPAARRRSDLAEWERTPPRGGDSSATTASEPLPPVVRCSLTPEAATATGLPLRAERGSLRETAPWATNQKRGLSRTRRLRSFPSRSSLKVDPDFRFERGVFAGVEPCKHRGACKAPADPANRVTIARFGFVAVRGLRPAPARDDRQVRDQSERGTACRSERYSAPPRNPPTTRALRRRRTLGRWTANLAGTRPAA